MYTKVCVTPWKLQDQLYTKKVLADTSVIKLSALASEQLCAVLLSDFYKRGICFKAFSTQCKNSIKKKKVIRLMKDGLYKFYKSSL